MILGICKWFVKNFLVALLWVSILSISYQGRPLFSYAYENIIMNSTVQKADELLAEMWRRFYETASLTLAQVSSVDEQGAPQ